MIVEEVMAEVLVDLIFYSSIGGGLALSGGELTFQYEFCLAILEAARERKIHTCLDTSCQILSERLRELHPLVDLWLFDYKATGQDEHLYWTGSDGALIRRNLSWLLSAGANVELTCPIVPSANDTAEHLEHFPA